MENIQVLIRVRPLNYRETHLGAYSCITTNQQTVTLDGKKDFTFDHVLGVESTQEHVFQAVGEPLAKTALTGINCCVFAYGQTGAGKTYTMQGRADEHWGLQPRLFSSIFNNLVPEAQWVIKCTFLEIYNEQLLDLLSDKPMQLTIREDAKRVYVENLQEIQAYNLNDALQLMQRGIANRHVSATMMNLESSRSHTIFTLNIESKVALKGVYQVKRSKLNFVDLAGSERQKHTSAAGERLKEAANINKSLSTLGLVINSLADQSTPKKFVPYRDSKLTFLLRESLGGNSKTFMIATISAASTAFQETLSTLKFASRTKQIKNSAVINEEMGGTVETLKAEIKRLKSELQQFNEQPQSRVKEIELISQISSLNYQLSESTLYQEQLSQEVNQTKEYYEGKMSELTELNAKYRGVSLSGMADKDNQLRTAIDIQREMRIKIDSLNTRIKELQSEEALLKHRRNEMSLYTEQLANELSQSKQDLQECQEELARYKEMTIQLEVELEQARESRVTLTSDLERKIDELSTQIQVCRDQMDTDQQTIEFQNDEIEKLSVQIEAKHEQCDKLEQFQTQYIQLNQTLTEELSRTKEALQYQSDIAMQQEQLIGHQKLHLSKKSKKMAKLLTLQSTTLRRQAIINQDYDQQLSTINQKIGEVYSQINGSSCDMNNNTIELINTIQSQLQQHEQLKEEFTQQKDKLSKFLESFDIISQKLIVKENESMKLRSELKLEQTQRAKSLQEIDKLRTTKVQLSNQVMELEQTHQQLNLYLHMEPDESKFKRFQDQITSLTKNNQKLNSDLLVAQRQYKQIQEEKILLQKKYEEKLMYSVDSGKLRKDISIMQQIKEQSEQREKQFNEQQEQLQLIDEFFKKLNYKRYFDYKIQTEGSLKEKITSYFEYLEKCEQEFEFKQYQLKTNLQLLNIEQASCNIIKEENVMLKMQLQGPLSN